MIKLIIGGIGSGKSVTAVKEITDRNNPVFTNFNLRNPNVIRLKTEHIISETPDESGKNIKKKVNWMFWNEYVSDNGPFDIVIDEAHNVMHSRRAMSSWNILFTTWLSQIRKILGSNEKNHLYLVTQRLKGIDLAGRDLCHEIIYVNKFFITNDGMMIKSDSPESIPNLRTMKTKIRTEHGYIEKEIPQVYIMKHHFLGEYSVDKFEAFLDNGRCYDYRTLFLANPYFKYYNSYELISFGETAYI